MKNITYKSVIRNHLSRMKEIKNPKNFKASVMILEAFLIPLISEKKEATK